MNSALAKINLNLARSLSAVSLHKLAQIAGTVATVMLVPRLFGAEDYGRFAFILSLSFLGQILGELGTLDVMGKFVPGMSQAEAARIYSRHIGLKLVVGLLCGLITAGAALWLVVWMEPVWALLTGLGVYVHIVAWVPFHLALGLNRVGVWMVEQAWRQWVLLALLLALLPLLGMTGALIALLLMELIFLVVGLWWVRGYWRWPELAPQWAYLRPYLRFGFGFFLANLTTVALYRSGPLLVETLTGDTVQTGYFNLALGLFMLAYVTTGQFAQSLIPTLSELRNRGDTAGVRRWINNFARVGAVVGVVGVAGVWLTADWGVPLVFGAEFGAAAESFKWISLGLPLAAALWAISVGATVAGRGQAKFTASLAGLGVFALASWQLAPPFGATGAALALVAALVINTVVLWAVMLRDGESVKRKA